MHDGPVTRETLDQVLEVLLPLLLVHVLGHVGGDGIGDSDDGRRGGLGGDGLGREVGFLVLDDVDGCERGCLGLAGSLGLSQDGVPVNAVAQADNAVGESFKKFNFLHAAHPAGFLHRGQLDRYIVFCLV